jgi:hypothetical protein
MIGSDTAAQPIGDDGRRPVAFLLGGRRLAGDPREDIDIEHTVDRIGDPGQILLQQRLGYPQGDRLLLFHDLDQVLAGVGQPNQPVASQRRACGHPQDLEHARMLFQHARGQCRQILGEPNPLLDMDGRHCPAVAVGFRCEQHEPLIEQVHGCVNIGFPEMGLVGIYGHVTRNLSRRLFQRTRRDGFDNCGTR